MNEPATEADKLKATLKDLQDLEDVVDEEMKKQPSYQRSAWAAIQEVMWQKRKALA
jgi:flagellar biosynthesis/type III secretory pathway chaperone